MMKPSIYAVYWLLLGAVGAFAAGGIAVAFFGSLAAGEFLGRVSGGFVFAAFIVWLAGRT